MTPYFVVVLRQDTALVVAFVIDYNHLWLVASRYFLHGNKVSIGIA